MEVGTPVSVKGDPIITLDGVVDYRIDRPMVSHEIKLDVQRVLNEDTRVFTYFDTRSGTI